MSANIFINYRKDDSRWNTQALYNELLRYFPKESIFKDFNTISPGDIYRDVITNALAQCDVLLVIIGKNWLGIKDSKGSLRLQDPNDLVRMEITTALKRNIKVIPVLYDNLEMFDESELPGDLQSLTQRQYVSVSDLKFESDVQRLAESIKTIIGKNKNTIAFQDHSPVLTENEKPSFKGRWKTALIVCLAGYFFAVIVQLILYSNDQRFWGRGHIPGTFNPWRAAFLYSIPAAVLWLVAGAVMSPVKNLVWPAIVSACIAFIIWIVIAHDGFYTDTVMAAVVFGMPVGALIGVLITLKRKGVKG